MSIYEPSLSDYRLSEHQNFNSKNQTKIHPGTGNMKFQWKWFTFDQLSTQTLYTILKLRQQVFVVEQKCAYQDCDNLDPRSWHLMGYHQDKLLAYCRVVYPGEKKSCPTIGRLLTHSTVRGKGIGRQLAEEALAHVKRTYPGTDTRISAQFYLVNFYQSLGFKISSEVYDEDGIPHIDMTHDHNQVKTQ